MTHKENIEKILKVMRTTTLAEARRDGKAHLCGYLKAVKVELEFSEGLRNHLEYVDANYDGRLVDKLKDCKEAIELGEK